MATTVLTVEDLQDFKKELLQELKTLFPNQQAAQNKKWLKSIEVRKMLSISWYFAKSPDQRHYSMHENGWCNLL